MKRLLGMVLGGVLAIAPLSAFADGALRQSVVMTDAELDQVTAAGSDVIHMHAHFIFNPGNATVVNRSACINCPDLAGLPFHAPEQHASGVHLMINGGHPLGKKRCFNGFTLGPPAAC